MHGQAGELTGRERGGDVRGGSVYGKSDPKGNTVVAEEVDAGGLFATIYSALGLNPEKNYYVNEFGRLQVNAPWYGPEFHRMCTHIDWDDIEIS